MHAKEAILSKHQIDTFCCQKRWMEHKRGHWLVQEECIVCILQYAKGTSWAKVTSSSEKVKLVVSSYACLKALVSQAVS